MSQPEWRARAAAVDDGGQVPTAGWIVGTSCWLIPVFFTSGGFTWLGFLIIGLMLLRPTWLVSAGVYGVWAIASIVIPDDQTRIMASALLTAIGIIHGLIANRRLLLTIWGRLERGEQWWGRGGATPTPPRVPTRRAATRPRGGPVDVPREGEELLAAIGTSRSDYLADAEPDEAPLPPPRGRRRSGAAPSRATVDPETESAEPAGPTATVDVNTATVAEFGTLTGFTKKRAEAAVAARTARSRFASVQEFADDLGLQPHELARLRDRLTCSRPRPSSFGRRVDL